MEKLKINHALIIVLILLITSFSQVFAQDILVSISTNYKTYAFDELWTENKTTFIVNHQTKDTISISNGNIKSISFNTDGQYELLFYRYVGNNRICKIDSITKKRVYFHENYSTTNKLQKEDVIGIFFNKDTSSINENFGFMISEYLEINQNEEKQIVVINNNGNSFIVKKLISIKDNKVNVEIINDKKIITKSYYAVNKTNKIEFNPTQKLNETKHKEYYFVSNEDKWTKAHALNFISDSLLNFNMVYKNNITELTVPKNSIKGLFFKNIQKQVNSLYKIESSKNSLYNSRHIVFSINAGYGYWDGLKSYKSIPADYKQEMQSGFTLDLNIDGYLSKNIAIGVKYNMFNTSFRIATNISEQIKLSFYGGNFVLSGIYGNNLGFYYTSFSVGIMQLDYNYSLNNNVSNYSGTTLGVGISPGIDFLITKHISLGVKGSVLYGKMKSIKDKMQNTLEFSPAMSCTHIDILASVKFIL